MHEDRTKPPPGYWADEAIWNGSGQPPRPGEHFSFGEDFEEGYGFFATLEDAIAAAWAHRDRKVRRGCPKWDDDIARKRGRDLLGFMSRTPAPGGYGPTTLVALGAKPGAALGVGDLPWYAWRRDVDTGVHVVTAPHPSGRASIVTRTPSGPITFRRALLPEILVGCPTLRPWHFTTRIDAIRADLGAALCPYDPAVGVIAATVAAEAHVSPGAMLDIHLAAERVSMLDIIRALAPAPGVTHKSRVAALADLFRIKRGSDIKARVASAEKTLVADYPADVLRATIGRYTALGVL